MYILIGVFLLITGVIITWGILIQNSLPELKPELVSNSPGILSVANNEPYLINGNKLFKINNLQLTLQKEFSNDSQIELNPFGNYITEKLSNNKSIYTLDKFQLVQKNTGRFFAWLTADSYLITSPTNTTEGTDAGDLTETVYKGVIQNNQKDTLFNGKFITYMLLANNNYIDIAQMDEEDNYDSLIISQFTKQKGLNQITNKRNFGYKPFPLLGFTLIQENTSARAVYILKDRQLTQVKINQNIQAITAIDENRLIYIDKDTDDNKYYLYQYTIKEDSTNKIAKLPVNFNEITSSVINTEYLFINSKEGIYRINIEKML